MGHEFTKDMLTIGIGNVELIEPSVRVNVARNLNVPQDLVKVHLVAHHLWWWVYPREAGYQKGPYFLKITVNDKDVTSQFDTDELMWESIKLYAPGTEFTTVSASSTIKNMYALLSPSPNLHIRRHPTVYQEDILLF